MTGDVPCPADVRHDPDTELLEPPVVVERSPVPPQAVLEDREADSSIEFDRPDDWPVP
ncbi:hypothetical protein [Flaviflagellibacter deserti]|uniref:Uncharacterized protein n=1 Tax=Flaviflagellibacter deserti TaxID=2267266 RepID=A0ABV9Z1F2_9HYPH